MHLPMHLPNNRVHVALATVEDLASVCQLGQIVNRLHEELGYEIQSFAMSKPVVPEGA